MEKQTQESFGERISYSESPAYVIARGLRDKGYDIADISGFRQTEPEPKPEFGFFFGILKDRPPVQRSFLGIKWNKHRRASYLGTLWFDNNAREARQNETWVCEVYGRENVSELTNVVEELSKPHHVKVRTILICELPRDETLLSDNYPGDC